MYSLVSYKIVYPSFTVQQIATPVQAPASSNSPLYNTTTLQTIPIVELPSGGQYKFEFSDTTFLQITLDTFTIQQTSIYESQINQDTFYQQTNNTAQPISTTSQVQGYQVTRQTTETLYLQGNSFSWGG